MADLTIRFTKRRDGSVVSRFERADGTATWQRKEGRHAGFFAFHDLSHYAVETTLGHRRGFYGLVAEGWDLKDFGTPWPRGPLPPDAEPAELIVGFLDGERTARVPWSAEQFNANARAYFLEHGLTGPPALTEADLDRLREAIREMHERWAALPEGETLVLTFDRKGAG
jgi:hypothetical protein